MLTNYTNKRTYPIHDHISISESDEIIITDDENIYVMSSDLQSVIK